MNIKKLTLGVALAFASVSAMADTFNVDMVNGTVGIQHTNVVGDSTGAFTDIWNFNNTSGLVSAFGAIFNGGVDNTQLPKGMPAIPDAPNIDFTSVILSGSVGSVNLDITNQAFVSIASLFPSNFTGPLTLTVNGVTTGAAASYGGNFNVTAVPEPESYALILAGLGLIGFVARRKSNVV